ncbi:MAG: hypothetical protein MMC33_009260 [Icmadophila ericetorum]|nr:hypothetical protein [Icmadophila ericetorum]
MRSWSKHDTEQTLVEDHGTRSQKDLKAATQEVAQKSSTKNGRKSFSWGCHVAECIAPLTKQRKQKASENWDVQPHLKRQLRESFCDAEWQATYAKRKVAEAAAIQAALEEAERKAAEEAARQAAVIEEAWRALQEAQRQAALEMKVKAKKRKAKRLS